MKEMSPIVVIVAVLLAVIPSAICLNALIDWLNP